MGRSLAWWECQETTWVNVGMRKQAQALGSSPRRLSSIFTQIPADKRIVMSFVAVVAASCGESVPSTNPLATTPTSEAVRVSPLPPAEVMVVEPTPGELAGGTVPTVATVTPPPPVAVVVEPMPVPVREATSMVAAAPDERVNVAEPMPALTPSMPPDEPAVPPAEVVVPMSGQVPQDPAASPQDPAASPQDPAASPPDSASMEPVAPVVHDPRGHGGLLFGDLSEAERFETYYFQESDGQVVIEAEHFATQRYGNDDYRGARWWMVNSAEVNVKDDVPEFQDRCELAIEELRDLDEKPAGSNQTIRKIITNHRDKLKKGWEDVFERFGCDPDETDATTASGNSYIELLPDSLFNDNNEVPHSACNWYVPAQGPKVYYRVNFSSSGNYTVNFRGLNRDVDSGDLHLGVAKTPGEAEKYQVRIGPPRTKDWEWVAGDSFRVDAGEYFVLLSGREDGFEVDKIVVSKGRCRGCNGDGPEESPRVAP